ncbi:MAG: DnaJ domain-containing protein [Mastigocoleus sp. MO_167.B18]|nr:DnaJ domain-containing protein [Mastigocoleus sp. MO_167.B18]
MDVVDCYRLLGLRSGASASEIKSSYRRLAQRYHPDTNPNDKRAKEKFIAVTEAYKLLLKVVPPHKTHQQQASSSKANSVYSGNKANGKEVSTKEKVKTKKNSRAKPPNLSETENRLKWKTYKQLLQFLKQRRFPQATALVEALVQRLPQDAEVRQWQAICYQMWAKQLIAQRKLLKARIYLKKALKADPKNKSLQKEVQRDFKYLEKIL